MRQFKGDDEYSVVITKLGRIDGKFILPPRGTKFAITPEESRLVREGFDAIQKEQEESTFKKELGVLTTETVDERAVIKGRPRTGQILKCVDCGKEIYVRKYRLDQKQDERRCGKCARQRFKPPIKVPKLAPEGRLTGCDKYHTARRDQEAPARAKAAKKHTEEVLTEELQKGNIPPEPDTEKVMTKKMNRHEYYEDHKKEIIADYKAGGSHLLKVKWGIGVSTWFVIRKRWRVALRAVYKKRTPTVREERGKMRGKEKEYLTSEDKMEITVGRFEEILREIEWLRGYRQAVLDIFGKEAKDVKSS